MNPDQLNGLITATSGLLGTLLWPAFFVFLAVRFGPDLMEKIRKAKYIELEGVGMKASLQEQKVEAATALGAAEVMAAVTAALESVKESLKVTPGWEPAELMNKVATALGAAETIIQNPETWANPASIANTVDNAVPDLRDRERLRTSSVLWVDDKPSNNRYERQALEALGIRVTDSVSTQDALERIRQQHFDLVISDMGRPGDSRAGYTLLEKLRASEHRIPFVIYARSRRPEHMRDVQNLNLLDYTNSPQELISIVTKALRTRSSN